MRFAASFTTLAVAASSAHAATNTIVNNCPFPIHYKQVSSTATGDISIASLASTSFAQFFDPNTGVAIKITKNLGDSKELQWAYTYHAGERIYYNLDINNGFPFPGGEITLTGPGAPPIVWHGVPGSREVKAALGEVDLTLTICAPK